MTSDTLVQLENLINTNPDQKESEDVELTEEEKDDVLDEQKEERPTGSKPNDNNNKNDNDNVANSDEPNAWMSMDITIEDVNVREQNFKIEGWLAAFWKDDDFDDQNMLKKKLKELNDKTKTVDVAEHDLDKLMERYVFMLNEKNTDNNNKQNNDRADGDKPCIPEQSANTDPSSDAHLIEQFERLFKWIDNKADKNEMNKKYKYHQIFTAKGRYGEKHYLNMTKYIKSMKDKYEMPFYYQSKEKEDNNVFDIFQNAKDYHLLGTKPIALEYNIEHKVFKLHIHFWAKLYESFENNDKNFPFESQFLNLQIPYNIDKYRFAASVPIWVEKAFCFYRYWKHANIIWSNAVLVRKIDHLQEWNLLEPWVDLRDNAKRCRDYGYEFFFSVIKLRIYRNPNWHFWYIIVPLFLMVSCSFGVFAMSDIDNKLSYVITLLLTVAAFQLSISEQLPYKSLFTLIDGYFLTAYLILSLLVCSISFNELNNEDQDEKEMINMIFGIISAVVWFSYSLYFVWKYLRNDCVYATPTKSAKCCNICYKTKKKQLETWMEYERQECEVWDNAYKLITRSKKPQIVLGTNEDCIEYPSEYQVGKSVAHIYFDPIKDEDEDPIKDVIEKDDNKNAEVNLVKIQDENFEKRFELTALSTEYHDVTLTRLLKREHNTGAWRFPSVDGKKSRLIEAHINIDKTSNEKYKEEWNKRREKIIKLIS